MYYYIFTHHGEYAAGAIGVIAASPEDAVRLVLEHGQREHEEDEKNRGMSAPFDGEHYYTNKDTVFIDMPDFVNDRWRGIWTIKRSAVVQVGDSVVPGVRFYEFHDG